MTAFSSTVNKNQSSVSHPGHHFHIYAAKDDAADQEIASRLFKTAKSLRRVTSSSSIFNTQPVGPHLYPQGRISVSDEDKEEFIKWFKDNSEDRSILCHPKATVFCAQGDKKVPDEIPDHLTIEQYANGKAMWIGTPLHLDLEKLDNPYKRSLVAPFDPK